MKKTNFLPTNMTEVRACGWEQLDVILLTGDAYVDHPSFGAAIVGRYLESIGVKVGIISAPDINKPEDFKKMGTPRWFFGVTAGNLDSMLMYMTASKKKRKNDDYIPKDFNVKRPKRAVIAYCNKLKQLFHKPQILIGGIEASLRRFAHYDYWENKVRRSILLDSRADMLVYGMAENPLKNIIKELHQGKKLNQIRNIRGTAVIINEEQKDFPKNSILRLNSFEEVAVDKKKYTCSSRIIHQNQSPYQGKILIQKYANRFLCVYPPSIPLSEKEIDNVYALPFKRVPHKKYKENIPAYEMIKFSITAMRGCFGGCTFCSLSLHQGKEVQSRSIDSIAAEVKTISHMNHFKGYISDVGGPTANMYKLGCKQKKKKITCKKLSCIYPAICIELKTEHTDIIKMLQKTRKIKNIKKIFIASGVRFDLANLYPEYIKELASHHVSGQLKVAPEHCHPDVLRVMKKPSFNHYEKFHDTFKKESKKAGLKQFLVPYFIASHPGCSQKEQFSLYTYLKKNKLRPKQTQDFIPLPMTLAADIYYTGYDPLTNKKIYIASTEKERNIQRALMLYYKPENTRLINSVQKKN